MVDLKVKIKIYSCITDTKYTSKKVDKYIKNRVHITVNSPRNVSHIASLRCCILTVRHIVVS